MYADHLTKLLMTDGERPYRGLIQYHMKRQSKDQLQRVFAGEVSNLPKPFISYVEDYLDTVNHAVGYDQEFWQVATIGDAFKVIIDVAIEAFPIDNPIKQRGDEMSPENHDLAMSLFQIPTVNFAYGASKDREMRKYIGIKKGFFT